MGAPPPAVAFVASIAFLVLIAMASGVAATYTGQGGGALCTAGDDATARDLEKVLTDGHFQGELQHLSRHVKLAARHGGATSTPHDQL